MKKVILNLKSFIFRKRVPKKIEEIEKDFDSELMSLTYEDGSYRTVSSEQFKKIEEFDQKLSEKLLSFIFFVPIFAIQTSFLLAYSKPAYARQKEKMQYSNSVTIAKVIEKNNAEVREQSLEFGKISNPKQKILLRKKQRNNINIKKESLNIHNFLTYLFFLEKNKISQLQNTIQIEKAIPKLNFDTTKYAKIVHPNEPHFIQSFYKQRLQNILEIRGGARILDVTLLTILGVDTIKKYVQKINPDDLDLIEPIKYLVTLKKFKNPITLFEFLCQQNPIVIGKFVAMIFALNPKNLDPKIQEIPEQELENFKGEIPEKKSYQYTRDFCLAVYKYVSKRPFFSFFIMFTVILTIYCIYDLINYYYLNPPIYDHLDEILEKLADIYIKNKKERYSGWVGIEKKLEKRNNMIREIEQVFQSSSPDEDVM